MTDISGIKKRFSALSRLLDERSRRLVAGAESLALPRGGISAVSRATGISRPVIRQGIAELKNPKTALIGRVRRPGGGRKRIAERDAAILVDLEKLVEPVTAAIRNPRCDGLVRACDGWQRNWASRDMWSATR